MVSEDEIVWLFLIFNASFQEVLLLHLVKAKIFNGSGVSSARRKSWDDMERKSIMLNMGGSCSEKIKEIWSLTL